MSESYAAELLLEEVPLPDDFESEEDEVEDDEVEDDEDDESEDVVDVDDFGDDAGELLDEEPRLSLR